MRCVELSAGHYDAPPPCVRLSQRGRPSRGAPLRLLFGPSLGRIEQFCACAGACVNPYSSTCRNNLANDFNRSSRPARTITRPRRLHRFLCDAAVGHAAANDFGAGGWSFRALRRRRSVAGIATGRGTKAPPRFAPGGGARLRDARAQPAQDMSAGHQYAIKSSAETIPGSPVDALWPVRQ